MKLNPNDALAILGYLKDEGIVTEEQIDQAITKNPGEDLKAVTEYLHMVMCVKIQDDCLCGYVGEEPHEDTWSLEHHARWLMKSEKIVLDLFITDEELLQEIGHFNEILSDIENASPPVGYLFKYYWKRVLKWEMRSKKNETPDTQ